MPDPRILVVDDEPEVIEVIREALSAEGYEVDAAHDAAAALALIREQIYDGALLDFNLPDMDGLTLHRHIREMDDELADHTIFMSGMVQSETSLSYYASDSSGFIPKPFRVADVLAAVRNLFVDPG